MNNSNPLYSIFPQYSHHELDQIYSEYSYDADAASEQITKGALDWNKNDAQRLKKKTQMKPQKRWVNKPKREYKDYKDNRGTAPAISVPIHSLPTTTSPIKLAKQDSAVVEDEVEETPTMSFILQHGKEKEEMVQADLSTLDLSQYIVLIPKSVYVKREKEIFDRQFTSILPLKSPRQEPEIPDSSKSVATTQTFGHSTPEIEVSSAAIKETTPLFNSVPVQDKLRLLGIDDSPSKSVSRGNSDLKDFVLNMGIAINEPTSPRTPPNTPVTAKPKYKKPFKKRYYNNTNVRGATAEVNSNK
eukprot:NODE_117_length_18986_cov_0.639540.p4 type:complete len:301 gc:universal NODE_117_length_18986_cov_0.639540:6793-5891(-)